MKTEIYLLLKYLLGTHSGPGAVLGSENAKVDDLGYRKASGSAREADRWAGGGDAVYGTLIKVYPECLGATGS